MTGEAIDYLSVGDLFEIAPSVLEEVAVRDAGLLAAASARPLTTVLGEEAYPTFEDRAAALLHSLVRNHAVVDGNERLAWSACRIFHLINGRDLAYSVDDAEHMMLSAAAGDMDVADIAAWLHDHAAS